MKRNGEHIPNSRSAHQFIYAFGRNVLFAGYWNALVDIYDLWNFQWDN